MTANSNNIEITRRTLLEVVFATTTAAAISGSIPLWPSDATARPIAEPFKIFLSELLIIKVKMAEKTQENGQGAK